MPTNTSGRPASSSRGAQPTDGKACEFIVYVDTSNVGHAFFRLIDAHGNQVVLGFYPFNLLLDDSNHPFDHSLRYQIDVHQHAAMLNRAQKFPAKDILGLAKPGQTIEQSMKGRWGLTGNCVTFVREVAKAGGISLPYAKGWPGAIPIGVARGMKKNPKMVCKTSDRQGEVIFKCVATQ